MIAHTQGWLHCDIPGTDASGVVKALMDAAELFSPPQRAQLAERMKQRMARRHMGMPG